MNGKPRPRRRSKWIGVFAALALVSLACANPFLPVPLEQLGVLERAQSQEKGKIRVTVAVPSRDETKRLFVDDLYRRRVQPVWIEIENGSSESILYLPVGTDAEYYTPIEAANIDAKEPDETKDASRNRYFFDASLEPLIQPGETRRGYVFTELDEGTKAFNVDIALPRDAISFTFFVPVPGLAIDHYDIDWDGLYPSDEIVELDRDTLLDEIARFGCCATDKKGEGSADPLNLIIIGEPEDVYYSFLRAGWDETETITRASLLRTAGSFLTGGEYRYSPVSSLFVFGRKQDVAFQKARASIHERNHLRLWMTSARFEGKPIWIGQISRDIGVRFTRKTITTHKIDADIDETREYLLEDLAYAQTLDKFGYAEGVGAATLEDPKRNLTGDPIFTDGYRLVLWLASTPRAIDDLEFVEWSLPPHERPERSEAP